MNNHMTSAICLDLPIPIETERLFIRPPHAGDGKIINQGVIESFENLTLWADWAQTRPSLEDSEIFARTGQANWSLKKDDMPLCVFLKNTNSYIGGTGYHSINWQIPSFETGYWLHTDYQNQGLMTEAINAITRYAFVQLKAKRLDIHCDANNIRSKKLAERLGFQLEATLRNHRLNPHTRALSDTLIYARINLDNLPPLEVIWGKDK